MMIAGTVLFADCGSGSSTRLPRIIGTRLLFWVFELQGAQRIRPPQMM
jgi:hypothetical protein